MPLLFQQIFSNHDGHTAGMAAARERHKADLGLSCLLSYSFSLSNIACPGWSECKGNTCQRTTSVQLLLIIQVCRSKVSKDVRMIHSKEPAGSPGSP